jgi:RNA polymerase-binding transcription factor
MLPINEIREKLLEQRRALLRQVVQVEDDLRWLDTNVEPEMEEEGQEENVARLLARLDDRGRAEIGVIDSALARIASGDYGRCVRCGEAIPPDRLQALPMAEMCLPCAKARERPHS